MTTLFQEHARRWAKGCGSCICSSNNKVVLARGQVPCDVLFIGEAPGVSENAVGIPFVGPAGKLLDDVIKRSLPGHSEIGEDGHTEHWILDLRVAFTNLVACFPRDEKEAGTNEPPVEAVMVCAPRLVEFVEIANPKLIVCVGALAERWVPKSLAGSGYTSSLKKTIAIVHPASILRANVAQRGLAIQKCVVTISNALEGL